MIKLTVLLLLISNLFLIFSLDNAKQQIKNYGKGKQMENDYKVTLEVSQEWLDIFGVISRNQEGFVWVSVKEIK